MTAPDPAAVARAEALVAATRRTVARRRLRTALAAVAAAVVAGGLALLAADALVALGDLPRAVLGPVALIAAALAALAVLLRARAWRPDESAAERLAEAAVGDDWRRLSAARDLARQGGELASAGAARLAAALPGERLADGLPRARAGRWLLAAGALVAIGAVAHLTVPRLWPAVWPRFADPYGDHPPFSLTTLEWTQRPERVRAGDAARFEVAVGGRPAGAPLLRARRADGQDVRVPMFQVGAGRWAGEIAGASEPLTVWVENGGTRTPRHALAIDLVPRLLHVDLRLESPAYARLDAESRRFKPGEEAELAALPGSRLVLRPVANRPLAALIVQRDDAPPQRLALSNGLVAIDDVAAGAWRLTVEAADGVPGHAQGGLRVSARRDEAPRVDFTAPGRDAVATPGMRVPVQAQASDDLGLVRVHRSNAFNQLAAPELLHVADGRAWRQDGALDLKELGVRPGDLISLVAVARDTLPGAGQFSATAQRHLKVISEEEYNRMLLKRVKPEALIAKYQPLIDALREAEQDAAKLRAEAARLPKDELDRKLAELARRARALQGKAEALKRDNPLFAIEPEIQGELARAARELAEAAEGGDAQKLPQDQAGEMLKRDLAAIVQRGRAVGLIARLRQLIDAEQNATARFEPLAEHRRASDADRVRLRELAGDEEQLAQALDDWLDLVPQLTAKLRNEIPKGPDGQPDREAAADSDRLANDLDALAQAVAGTDASALKRQSASAAKGGDGVEARRLAALARDRLLALLPRCASAQGQCESFGLRLSWCRGAGFGKGLLGLGLAGNGWGLGGVGSGGLGFALGYGGDDQGGSDGSMAMDLYGPESFGDMGGQRGDQGKDGIAAIAGGGSASSQAAAAYQQGTRRTTGRARAALSAEQQKLVDEYFRRLEAEKAQRGNGPQRSAP